MGTEISLDLAGLCLGSSKNHIGIDHGALFQAADRKRVRAEEIDQENLAEQDGDEGLSAMGFVRQLRDVVPRLELLGFTLKRVEREYALCVDAWCEDCRRHVKDGGTPWPEPMDFPEFLAFVAGHPVKGLDDTFVSLLEDDNARIRGRFTDEAILRRIPRYSSYDSYAYSERSFFAGLIGFLHPYSMLRLLGVCPPNLDAELVWQYGPLVNNGWADEREFVADARRTETFLVATEGSSDAHILERAFALLKPAVADFFRFIDSSQGHPFPGTGNLRRFAEGLAKIDVHNQTLFLFDNDAEGFDAHKRVQKMKLPANMRAMMLPDLELFRAFPSRGPEGTIAANINGRAAAIECYLDLGLPNYPPAKVVWTNLKEDLGIYHGALEHKESYVRHFMDQSPESIASGSYEVTNLIAVLDAIVAECTSLVADVTPVIAQPE